MSFDASQCLRDLLWVVNSPSLLCSRHAEALADVAPIAAEDIDEEALVEFLSSAPGVRVGRYFEQLVQFYLQKILQAELVSVGELIKQEDGQTRGELDFVFRHGGRLLHWETAVKFFLCCRHSGRTAYLGPNPNDSLDSKVERLFHHQLPLGGEVHPSSLSQAFVRGRIFYHPMSSPVYPPASLAPTHLRGHWIRQSELPQLRYLGLDAGGHLVANRLCIVEKPHWLAPVECDADNPVGVISLPLGEQHLARQMDADRRPRLVSLLAQRKDILTETKRVFVVPDHWPGQPP